MDRHRDQTEPQVQDWRAAQTTVKSERHWLWDYKSKIKKKKLKDTQCVQSKHKTFSGPSVPQSPRNCFTGWWEKLLCPLLVGSFSCPPFYTGNVYVHGSVGSLSSVSMIFIQGKGGNPRKEDTETVQWFRVLAALSGDLGLAASTHIWFTNICIFCSKKSDTPPGLHEHSTHIVHIHIRR